MRNIFSLIINLVLISACATDVPLEIRQDITESPVTINAVRSNFARYEGTDVRWGGIIAAVENNQSDTWIEVVGRDLGSYGQPVALEDARGQGRFIARVDGFLDPVIYKVNRGITVYGTIEAKIVRTIDEHPYTYPLIKAKSNYLWSNSQLYPYRAYYYPYYPYGYYYPYYPYRFNFGLGYGFGHHRHYHFGMHHYYGW
jgi:outer membrane lipoprotein